MENKETKFNQVFECVVSYCDWEMNSLECSVQTCEQNARRLFKTVMQPPKSYDPRQDLKVHSVEEMRQAVDSLRQKAEQMCEQLQNAIDELKKIQDEPEVEPEVEAEPETKTETEVETETKTESESAPKTCPKNDPGLLILRTIRDGLKKKGCDDYEVNQAEHRIFEYKFAYGDRDEEKIFLSKFKTFAKRRFADNGLVGQIYQTWKKDIESGSEFFKY